MKTTIILALVCMCLAFALYFWHADHATLSQALSNSAKEKTDLEATLAATKDDVATSQAEKDKLAQDFDSFREGKNRELKSAGDDYLKLLEAQDENQKLRAALKTNDDYDKQQAILLSAARQLNQQWQQWGNQRNADYNKLLGYYHDVYNRYVAIAATPPSDPSVIHYEQMGVAGKDFEPQPPSQTVIIQQQPSSSSATIIDHGDGTATVIGQ